MTAFLFETKQPLLRLSNYKSSISLLVMVLSLVLLTAAACQTGGEKPKTWTVFLEEGHAALKAGDGKTAQDSYEHAVHDAEKKFGAESPQALIALGYLAQLYKQMGEWKLAYVTYKRLVPLKEKIDPTAKDDIKQFKDDFAVVKQKLKDYGISTGDEPKEKKVSKKPTRRRKRKH